jgi:hypothetical protein
MANGTRTGRVLEGVSAARERERTKKKEREREMEW